MAATLIPACYGAVAGLGRAGSDGAGVTTADGDGLGRAGVGEGVEVGSGVGTEPTLALDGTAPGVT
jgi:hypothetical protein